MSGREAEAVAEAIRIIRAAGRSELLSQAAALEEGMRGRPLRRASKGVAAAVMACSPPRTRRSRADEAQQRDEAAQGQGASNREEGTAAREIGARAPSALVESSQKN